MFQNLNWRKLTSSDTPLIGQSDLTPNSPGLTQKMNIFCPFFPNFGSFPDFRLEGMYFLNECALISIC